MGTKTIRVREEVYERLKARKRPDESFSDLLDRLTDRDAEFARGFGALSHTEFNAPLGDLDERAGEEFRSG